MDLLTLDIEKAAAGGRMLARHDGQVVLVAGAIPGERVVARIERAVRGVSFAEVVDVVSPSGDRRPVSGDPRCGGNAFVHVQYPRQLQLKAQIIQDAFVRIGRVSLDDLPEVTGSPEHGYRMRARLHARNGRLGFFLEGTHRVCDATATRQLLPETAAWIENAQRRLSALELKGLSAIELAENVSATERACHLELESGVDVRRYISLSEGLVGLSASSADLPGARRLSGHPVVTDTVPGGDDQSSTLRISRSVRAFFQGNRFLLDELIRRVTRLVPPGPVVDLYAGVGLFGLSLAVAGRGAVVAVEGDPVAGADLARNAVVLAGRVEVMRQSVESYLAVRKAEDFGDTTIIVDPPRTGLSRDAIGHLVRMRARRLIYISCDVATLARDARILLAEGYNLAHLSSLDLFPNTAHVETIAAFGR